MYDFDYLRASSVTEAVAAVGGTDNGRFLAGGMTLVPALKQRLASPSLLVDLRDIEHLRGLTIDGTSLDVGAMTTHAAVEESVEVGRAVPVLAALAATIGDPQVRNRGTIGGSIANNDPAADYPAAALGLGATIITDRRGITSDTFFAGMFDTALQPNELIIAVNFPIPHRAGYAKFRQPASRYALVAVLVACTSAGVRVAVTGASPCVFRHIAMEEALEENFSPRALNNIDIDAAELISDMHGSSAYRAHLVRVLAQRAVAAAR
ncbi:MAG: FAD binding domain-containing protein [Rhodospirillales bacterium]|nr:FAD binding domain-containing protein [Rhodospirillales bacterium]